MEQSELFNSPIPENSQKAIVQTVQEITKLFNSERYNIHLKRAYIEYYEQLQGLVPQLTILQEKVYGADGNSEVSGSNL